MHKDRALWVSLGVLLLVMAAFYLRQNGPSASFLPPCLFRTITTLDCPGCGMTRAAHATLNGHIAEAFRYNPLGMILLPLASIALGLKILGWVRGKPMPVRFQPGKKNLWSLVVLIFVYWILRNISVWPFTLLAPP